MVFGRYIFVKTGVVGSIKHFFEHSLEDCIIYRRVSLVFPASHSTVSRPIRIIGILLIYMAI